MSDVVERFDLCSQDIAEEKRGEILRLFPETSTEGGKIDFERLKQTLGEIVDVGKERYGMNWPGKADCFKTIQAPSMGTLRPFPEESVSFDTTENLIIEGDNLEVLKLLQKSYLGKVKIIYIDPPYNTGNDFIYPDNYTESLQTYLKYTGQVDAEGKKFSTNTDAQGRFHSKWLNMMYPRLYLARDLLQNDGVIFISIDDTEIINLRAIMNDIFGEEQFIEQVIWKNKYGSGAPTTGFASVHEYILCYSKTQLGNLVAPLSNEQRAQYKNQDEYYSVRGGYVTQPLSTKTRDDRENLVFPIIYKGIEIWPDKQWIWSKERVAEAQRKNELVFNQSENKWSVRFKQYLRTERGIERRAKPVSILEGPFNQDGTKELRELLGDDIYSFPKPSSLIKFLLSFEINDLVDKNFIALDFFAGSGSTAHAVLDLNTQDGGNRKFVLVQLPEPCDPDTAAYKAGYKNISEVCKERVRRVIIKLHAVEGKQLQLDSAKRQNNGFRVFKLAESNFKSWNTQIEHDTKVLEKQLELHIAHIREGRGNHDILCEILLKSGFPLATPMEKVALGGKEVYSVASGTLLICLERELTLELVRMIADLKAERVVCLDEGFGSNDQLKANAIQIFKAKGVVSFKTV